LQLTRAQADPAAGGQHYPVLARCERLFANLQPAAQQPVVSPKRHTQRTEFHLLIDIHSDVQGPWQAMFTQHLLIMFQQHAPTFPPIVFQRLHQHWLVL
jgi:hypothetical protein